LHHRISAERVPNNDYRALLAGAISAQDVPGLVAMAATETGGLRGDGLSAAVSRDLPMPASPDSSTT
jgi:hypothetical protein